VERQALKMKKQLHVLPSNLPVFDQSYADCTHAA